MNSNSGYWTVYIMTVHVIAHPVNGQLHFSGLLYCKVFHIFALFLFCDSVIKKVSRKVHGRE